MSENKLFTYAPSPESLGIPSSAIYNFLERIDSQQTCMHGFLLLRNGQVAAEGYWAPYSENSMHRMYSVSKSFVSLAVGLLIDEGRLKLDDCVVKYFGDKAPGDIHPYLAQATVRDLLMMATPNSSNSYTRYDNDWAATFFNKKPSHPPGTIFSYDTAGTVILNTIVERISGVPFLEYMRDKLLDPIGFSKDAWCIKTPEGTSWGGSGVICRLKDMARLAYVCLNGGRWGDRQLLSEKYIREATSKQIDNSLIGKNGYGYQIWMERDNGFSFRGMGSQFAFCFPGKDLLFACISDTQGAGPASENIDEVFYEEIYDKTSDLPLPGDDKSYNKLQEKIKNLKILPQRGNLTSSYERKINGKWFILNENPMKISRMRLIFKGDAGIWEYENATGHHELKFGIGKKAEGTFPETHYYGERIGIPAGRGYNCLASAAWVEEHKLNMLVYITDYYLGTLKATFAFKGNEISIYMTKVAEWFLDEYVGFAGGVLEV
ncbi:MAG: serine hydrolase [Clostridiaceae bacterium]|nr:serine hydrolase [Clostridiaceae bacterium]